MRFLPQSVGPIHFIGIGGIGMSGIADILVTLGYQVQGSDLIENYNTDRLKARGVTVFIGHTLENIDKAAVIVISSGVKAYNSELIEARRRGLPVVKRAEMLAEIMRLKPSIAIAGTHGKTTTTSLSAAVLEAGGLDPTVISGGIINAYGTNARLGKGEWVIAEADESDGSFVKLPATIAVVTNIEAEHMDYYASIDDLKKSFYTFIENIPFYGLGIVCRDSPMVREMLPQLTDRRIISYGFDEGCDVQAFNIQAHTKHMTFDLRFSEHFYRICPQIASDSIVYDIQLSLSGNHNVQNALATIVCGLELGMSWQQIRQGLQNFAGVNRRFTIVGCVNQITIIDDYAHHPTEISAVLKAAKSIASGKVIAVIQPHRYSRVHYFFDEFTKCFDEADHVIFTPLYDAGEAPIDGINHETLAKAVSKTECDVHTVATQEELAPLIHGITNPNDYIICMGAGSITYWAKTLYQQLERICQTCTVR